MGQDTVGCLRGYAWLAVAVRGVWREKIDWRIAQRGRRNEVGRQSFKVEERRLAGEGLREKVVKFGACGEC